MKKVAEVMNKNMITIDAELTLEKIIKLMQEHGVGELPVLKDKELIGVVTRDDILAKKEKAPLPPVIAFWDLLITLPGDREFQEKVKKLSAYYAKDIMSHDYLVVKQEDDLEEVITTIVEEGYQFAIVANGNSLEGIITRTDLINKCFD